MICMAPIHGPATHILLGLHSILLSPNTHGHTLSSNCMINTNIALENSNQHVNLLHLCVRHLCDHYLFSLLLLFVRLSLAPSFPSSCTSLRWSSKHNRTFANIYVNVIILHVLCYIGMLISRNCPEHDASLI